MSVRIQRWLVVDDDDDDYAVSSDTMDRNSNATVDVVLVITYPFSDGWGRWEL